MGPVGRGLARSGGYGTERRGLTRYGAAWRGEAVEDSQYRMGGVRCGSAVLVRIFRVGRGTAWHGGRLRKVRSGFIRAGRLRYGAEGCGSAGSGAVRFGEAVVVGLVGATSGVTWRLRSGVVWFVAVRLDMAVLIRHEQVRHGGVR